MDAVKCGSRVDAEIPLQSTWADPLGVQAQVVSVVIRKISLLSIQADVTIQVHSFCKQIFSGVIRRATVYNKIVRITFSFHRQSTVWQI